MRYINLRLTYLLTTTTRLRYEEARYDFAATRCRNKNKFTRQYSIVVASSKPRIVVLSYMWPQLYGRSDMRKKLSVKLRKTVTLFNMQVCACVITVRSGNLNDSLAWTAIGICYV